MGMGRLKKMMKQIEDVMAAATFAEEGVPEALLEVVEKDQNLNVVKTALDAFESITGFESPDVFGYEFAKKWWDEHKEAKIAAQAVK
mgnify:CR=1 FL=1